MSTEQEKVDNRNILLLLLVGSPLGAALTVFGPYVITKISEGIYNWAIR